MSLVVVEATIVVDESKRDDVVASITSTQQATRDDEDGCLVYCFAADPVHANTIQVFEMWESEDALHQHFDHPNYFAMRDLIAAGGLVSAESRKHRVDATAPVYDATFTPSGHFD
ncbi:MAG: antibiotic biosynthesis monooxygenase [Actinomycetota bacterium]